jgi:OPA family glycerol-3-phosphate transporter-like MFS transporter
MSSKIDSKCKKAAWLCTFIYFASYITRINFAVMLVKICSDLAVEKTELSFVVVGLTIFYGAGQVLSGFLGDRIKPTLLITLGAVTTIICNAAMFFCETIPVMTVVWCINGLAQALFWPPIVRILASHFSDREYSFAVIRVSWGSQIATVLLYLACPLLLPIFSWRVVMLLCAAVASVLLVIWMVFAPRVFGDEEIVDTKTNTEERVVEKTPFSIFFPVVLIILGILCMGVLRDGVNNWMPSYLNEAFGMSEEDSILSTVFPAIVAIAFFQIFGGIQQKFVKNEVLCASIILFMSSVSALVLYLLDGSTPVVSTILMSLIIGCMHGVNLMLITIVPKRFVKYGIVSTMSGVLNACTYVGAAVSTYGFAALSEVKGWDFTILMWFAISAVGMAITLGASFIWRKYYKAASGN